MFNSPWREMMYNDNSYQPNYDCRDASHYNSQLDSSGMTDSDSGRDSGVAPNALPNPDDVMMPYERRVPTSPSSTYSENNYAEIPGQDSFVGSQPFHNGHPAVRYIPDLPGNYMFNENRRSPDISRDLPTTHRQHDPTSGSQGSPDSGVGFYPIQRTGALPLTNTHSNGNILNVPTTLPQTMAALPTTQHYPTPLGVPHTTQLSDLPAKTIDIATVPLPDRRSRAVAECDFYQTKPKCIKKRKSIMYHVLAMTIAGVLYLAIGITAGYFIGKGGCPECAVAPCPTPLPLLPTTNNATNSSSTTAESTAATTTTTPATTTESPETTESPSHCVNANGVCRCGPFGGDAEREFNDRDVYLQNGNITSFVVNHNEYFIGSIQFWYGKTPGPQHGYTTSGYEVKVDLAHNEIITDVHVDFTSGKPFLTRLQIRTNLRVFGPYGGRAGEQMTTQGARLLYIAGRAGAMIDQLSLYFNRCN